MLDINDFCSKQVVLAQLNRGDKISYQNDNLLIKNCDNKTKCQVSCYKLFAVILLGHTSISTGLIQRANKFGFSIVLATNNFRVYQIIEYQKGSNTILHYRQYNYDSWDIAKKITFNKVKNQRKALMNIRNKNDDLGNDIDRIDKALNEVGKCDTLNQIMAYEGTVAHLYFKNIFGKYGWQRRQPRVKPDMINSLLDIGYTVLFTYIELLLDLYGFDTYYGVMHRQFYMRKSLVCDLVEPFRVIIDTQICKAINLRQFKEKDFKLYSNRYELEWKKSSEYVSLFLQAILDRKEDIFRYIQAYYRAFMKNSQIEKYPMYEFR